MKIRISFNKLIILIIHICTNSGYCCTLDWLKINKKERKIRISFSKQNNKSDE